jgi:predicted DCC family thiol-disulfide oxidoreductase YuxK
MGKNGPKGSPNAEQTSEYLLVGKLGERFPRLRQTLLDLFSIDLRTLALTRVMFALIVLVELVSRLSDLRAFYSDDGLVPRAAVHQALPRSWFVSLHFLSGRAEIGALMFSISGIFALLLLVGYRTRLAAFWTWLLFSSLCTRNPYVVHGGDSLLEMLLFWGMFVPWGARYSVDSALNPAPNALPTRVFSVGTIALLLQMPLVYFFGGVLKNGLEWRHDFTAILYSLKAPDFALPFGVWMTSYPGLLKVLTACTLVLEMAGALLLFCPFRTKAVRFFVILAFFFLQLGMALTLSLALFPVVSTAALLPFVASSFWNRFFRGLRTAERTGLHIYYDADCGFCKKSLRLIRTFFLLPETQIQPAQSDLAIQEDMRQHNSWVVIDNRGKKHFKFDALIAVFRVSPLLWPITPILSWGWIRERGTWLYECVANNRGPLTHLIAGLRHKRLTVRQSVWLTVVCALCLTYVVVDNFGSVARSPIRIPAKVTPMGQLLNIHQNWKMFAPSPLRTYTQYVVVGKLADGRELDLWTRGQVNLEKPEDGTAWVKNNRWRTYMRLIANDKQRSLRPYFASYVCRYWNARHSPEEAVRDLTFYKVDEPISLDAPPQQTQTTLLWQQPCGNQPEADASKNSP